MADSMPSPCLSRTPMPLRHLLFAFALNGAGLTLATIGLVVVSGIAYREFCWRELSALGITLSLFAIVVFVYGLGLPFHALPA